MFGARNSSKSKPLIDDAHARRDQYGFERTLLDAVLDGAALGLLHFAAPLFVAL